MPSHSSSRRHPRRRPTTRRRRSTFESLEARNLLAVFTATADLGTIGLQNAAVGNDPYAKWAEARIEAAFERVSDLSQYTTAEIQAADTWVINLAPGGTLAQLQSALGASNLEATSLIPDTYYYTLPAAVNRAGVGAQLQSLAAVEYAYPLTPVQLEKRFVPNDSLYNQQWHLNNIGQSGGTANEDANVEAAWDIARGAGVVIGIVDDGLEYTHPDLAANYVANLSIDVLDGDNNPQPDPFLGDYHGTSVGGVAAGVTNNNLGISGAAPSAQLAGIRFLGAGVTAATTAQAITHQNQQIDIYNNSWGPGSSYIPIDPLEEAALQQSAGAGRGGLGSIQVFANGNAFQSEFDSNYDVFANSLFTIAVGALDHHGNQSSYSTIGANLLISAPSSGGPSGIYTTDIAGAEGYNYDPSNLDGDALADLNYTSTFGGTSSAAPLVSGIIALMLEANPALTWRDVEHILVRTARKNDPTNLDWTTNGAGRSVNHAYGFGAIDAAAAVALADTWTNVAAPQLLTTGPQTITNGAIPDGDDGLVVTIDIQNDLKIETIELVVDITHNFPEELDISIFSPDGTESVLNREHFEFFATNGALQGWTFTSKRHWDELLKGTWTILIRDQVAGDAGTLNSIEFNVLGTTTTQQPSGARIQGTVFGDYNFDSVLGIGDDALSNVTVYVDNNNNSTLDANEPFDVSDYSGSFAFNGLPAGTYNVRVAPNVLQTPVLPAGGVFSVTLTANQVSANNGFLVQPPPVGAGPYILTNGTGDGTITVGVDGFGSFGSVMPDGTDATYDPIGTQGPGDTTFESAVAVGFGLGYRTYLSTGISEDDHLGTPANPLVTGSSTQGASSFIVGNLLFQLNQELFPLIGGGATIGTELRQTYTITNIGRATQTFDMVRYFDGDLGFDAQNGLLDGGGRLVVNGTEILFETDTATGSANSNTFIGITASGGTAPATARYEAEDYPALLSRIYDGDNLDHLITNDSTDADEFVDVGNEYDITLALRNIFTIAPGQSSTYIASTLFGTGIPDQVAGPTPPPPPPPQPITISGNVIADVDGDGVLDPGEGGVANAIVFLDLNNDGQLSIGEPAQISGPNGEYFFIAAPGTYVVRPGPAAGWTSTGGTIYTVTGSEGQAFPGLNFYYRAVTDHGDAPSPFPTLLSQNGPTHSIITGLYLGTGVDGELDGQPTALANGDDLAADDENGVIIVNPLQPGQTGTLDVLVGPAIAGMLHGWIDFNADGDWDDPGEHILSNQKVIANTTNRVTFAVPASAVLGNVYARFRYGYGNAVSYTGPMLGGEVEDFRVAIVTTTPVARPDSFTVDRNSTANKLDVKVNDVASSKGDITIIGVARGPLNGTVTINSDQTLSYTPPANTIGVDTIKYTISDGKGGIVTTSVTINVIVPLIKPVALDDIYSVGVNSVGNFLDVAVNDQQLTGGAALARVLTSQTTVNGGYVTNASPLSFRYAPPYNFTGLDRFQYTLRDASGLEATATVTVFVGSTSQDDTVGIELTVTDTSGAAITEIEVGQEFQLHVLARDKRNLPTDPGVWSAYFDLLYPQGLIAPKAGATSGIDATFSTTFNTQRTAGTAQAGLIDELGATRTTAAPVDLVGAEELVTITFVANAIGIARISTDPADTTGNAVNLGNPPLPVSFDKVTYGKALLSVVAATGNTGNNVPNNAPNTPFRNSKNAYDVNGDRVVSPLDALTIVNELNSRGTYSLSGRARAASESYVDVSGDNFFSPLDALLVVNRLNLGIQSYEGEGEDTSIVEVSPTANYPPPNWLTSGDNGQDQDDDNDDDPVDLLADDVAGAWNR